MRTVSSDGELSAWSFATEAKTEKEKKTKEKGKNKNKKKKQKGDGEGETPGAPPPAPVLKMTEEETDTMRTLKMLEGLQIFFGTQAIFLKDLVATMQNKKYKSNETITGRSGSGKGGQKI